MLDRARALAARAIEHIKQKSLRYWVSATLVFLATFFGSQKVYDLLSLGDVRASYFQILMDHPRVPKPGHVSLAFIDDNEYWNGEPDGRAPLKRDYLARIVDRLVAANATVIALDFDARLPNPESLLIPEAYKDETCKLIGAIKRGTAAGRSFVLSTPISFDAKGRYRRDTDIYQANGLCTPPSRPDSEQNPCGDNAAFTAEEKKKISCGYIALPYDILAIPGEIDIDNGTKLDSFGLAVARAAGPGLIDNALWQSDSTIRYGNYISEKVFEQAGARFSTAKLISAPDKIELGGRYAVIVGAEWRSFAVGRGPGIDLHPTPLGMMPGALLHANFAEAILDDRSAAAAPNWLVRILEVIFSLMAALLLAFASGFWRKLRALFLLFVALLVVQWVTLHTLAMFFDAFLPLLGLGLHALYERILGMHEESSGKEV